MSLRRAGSGMCLLLVCSLLSAGLAHAQEKRKRPRIGLVLAGGSARGQAHVGVLRWFEEHRIPVDYIVGASMGGLVAGLYASGYSAQEMAEFAERIPWDDVLRTTPRYRQLNFRRKEDRWLYPNKFEIGFRSGLNLPPGFSSGHGVGLIISRFAAPYARMKSFDDLPTPFRCVAVDLAEGNEVVFDSGDLFDALRATMSLPGIFKPVVMGKMVLVDGGILNNLPVDVARAMGADVVIAVTISLPDEGDISKKSLLGVAARSLTVVTHANERRNMKLADLVLAPDLTGLSSLDFGRFRDLEKRGYEAAAHKARSLEAFAVDETEWQAYVAERQKRRRPEQITPRFVEVAGVPEGTGREFEKRIHALQDLPIDTHRLEAELNRVTGLGRYDAASYRQAQRDAETGLLVKVEEKNYAPPILNTALTFDVSNINDARFGIGARLTFLDAGSPSAEWRTDFLVGTQNRVLSEYYWRLRDTRWFVAPRGFVDYSRAGVFQNDTRAAYYNTERLGAGIDLGFAAGYGNEIRIGYQAEHLKAFVSTGSPVLPKLEGLMSQFHAQWIFAGLDSAQIPDHGQRVAVGLKWVLDAPQAPDEYPIFESHIVLARPLGGPYSVVTSFAGGTTAGRGTSIASFTLGGPFQLSALSPEQLRGNNYYFGGFYLLRSLTRPSFLGRTYLSFGYELGNAFDDSSAGRPFHDGLFGLVGDTAFGAFSLGVSFGESGERKVFFRLGRLF